ncbi:MAG: hypothetical protein GY771_05675 [bacterium]|nr:hypothetical protein [bacterium]
MKITKDLNVDDLIGQYPWANGFMIKLGYPCIRCGEAFWGTLGELMNNHSGDVDDVVSQLNEELGKRERQVK